MVRTRAAINESEDAASSRSKLTSTLCEYVTDPEERRWIEPRLAHLLGLSDAPPGEREELYSAWRTFFERVSEHGPTVMVFEDLQWADPGLVDFVESILEWSRNHPILVITLSRPELRDRRPNWGAGQRAFTSLHLEPLSSQAMAELLDGFVKDLPFELKDKILERSEGVPLYAVETVRMLADKGVLTQEEGIYHLAGEIGSLEIPDTLHALIASRLDTLSTEQRSLLEDASVVGRTFTTASLAVVHDGDENSLEAHLRDLVRREFLLLDTDPRSPERGQYGFVQGLIAEVAYATLSRRDRSAKHLALAHHLGSLADDGLTSLVAAHYVEAHRAVPEGPEADLIAVAARDWLSRAGRRALSLGSPEQALVFFGQALEVTTAGAERAALLELAGEAAEFASVHDRALALYEEAIAYHEATGNANAVGRATVGLARVFVPTSRLSDAIERCERAFHVVGDDGDERVRAKLACQLAWAHSLAGSYERALEWSEMALVLFEGLDDIEPLAQAIGAKSCALFNLGRHREAVILERGRVALAEAAGSLLEQGSGWMDMSLYIFDDAPRESLSAISEAAELCRRAGHRGLELANLINGAEVSLFLGEWSDTRAALTELRQRDLSVAQRAYLAGNEAMLAALMGNPEEASACLDPYSDRLAASESVTVRATYLMDRALMNLATGDIEAARRESAEAVSADPLGINSPRSLAIQARACLWLGDVEGARAALTVMQAFRGRRVAAARLTVEAGLAALEERATKAAGAYRGAIEAWRTLACTLDLALCELDLVLLLGPDHPDATVAKEARDIFTQLGAKPFLERLNRAAGTEQIRPTALD
jgi:tetratricopeptide (TPR) repeat protein